MVHASTNPDVSFIAVMIVQAIGLLGNFPRKRSTTAYGRLRNIFDATQPPSEGVRNF
jgi:hypothetical protein